VEFRIAYIETPTQQITKGRAVMTEDHLTVYNVRSGEAIIDVDLAGQQINEQTWAFGQGAELIVVQLMTGCGTCGGTRILDIVRDTVPTP
jgi:hypothetical protein